MNNIFYLFFFCCFSVFSVKIDQSMDLPEKPVIFNVIYTPYDINKTLPLTIRTKADPNLNSHTLIKYIIDKGKIPGDLVNRFDLGLHKDGRVLILDQHFKHPDNENLPYRTVPFFHRMFFNVFDRKLEDGETFNVVLIPKKRFEILFSEASNNKLVPLQLKRGIGIALVHEKILTAFEKKKDASINVVLSFGQKSFNLTKTLEKENPKRCFLCLIKDEFQKAAHDGLKLDVSFAETAQ